MRYQKLASYSDSICCLLGSAAAQSQVGLIKKNGDDAQDARDIAQSSDDKK